jgi:hypothetical protein
VKNLLQKIASPFTDQVADFQPLEKFKVPNIAIYTKLEDPIGHLDNFRAHLDLHRIPDEVACRAFPLTLSGNARDLFRKLPLKSINDFDALSKTFPTQYLAGRIRRKPARSLKRGPNESLKDYIVRFN